jgi:hypothetical protein
MNNFNCLPFLYGEQSLSFILDTYILGIDSKVSKLLEGKDLKPSKLWV